MQLLEHLEDWKQGVEQELKREEHVERVQKKGRSAFAKKVMVKQKKQRGEIKEMRKRIR
jgi:hypothetical protein